MEAEFEIMRFKHAGGAPRRPLRPVRQRSGPRGRVLAVWPPVGGGRMDMGAHPLGCTCADCCCKCNCSNYGAFEVLDFRG